MSKPLAFVTAHKAGSCDVAWAGADALLTVGPDGRVCCRAADHPAEVKQEAVHGNNGAAAALNCLAYTAKDDRLAVVDDQCFVEYYKGGCGAAAEVATRFTLPARAVVFSPGGRTAAAAGDDNGIKLLDCAAGRVFRTLRAPPYTRGLAFDPEGAYLASANADGSLSVWSLESGKPEVQRKGVCPKLYERLSWEPASALKGSHSADVSLLAFSKNGLYLASAGADQAICVWDLTEATCLEKRLLPGAATGLAWHPSRNALAVITEDGELAVWEGVVPANLSGPAADVDALMGLKKAGAGGAASPGGALPDNASVLDGVDGSAGAGEDASDDYDRNDSFLADSGRGGARRGARRRTGAGAYALLDLAQDPVHPGSTQLSDAGRRYLAYNTLGCVILRQEDDHNVVEVAFHDTQRMRRRIPLITDFFGFTMASLGDKASTRGGASRGAVTGLAVWLRLALAWRLALLRQKRPLRVPWGGRPAVNSLPARATPAPQGALYASPSSKEAPSTLVYRPFESWAANSDWSLGLPAGEEAVCVATGHTFCAAATSRRALRIFSQAGLQNHVLAVEGEPVALAAAGHQLAVVWQAGGPSPAGDQALAYAVHDVSEQRRLHGGVLPLSPGARLTWLGFSEEGLLAAGDSEGELRVRGPEFGGAWVTVFSAAAERKSTEQYWLVGLSAKELTCIVCATASEPAVPAGAQRPVVSTLPLRVPVVAHDAAAPLEAESIRQGVVVGHLAAAAAEASDAEEAAELEAALSAAQLEADRISVRLVQKLVAGDRHARALEVASQLHSMAALEGALKLASHHRAGALADRISAFVEQRMAMEAAAQAEQEQYGHGHAGGITPPPAPGLLAMEAEEAGEQPSPGSGAAATAGAASRVSPLGRPYPPAAASTDKHVGGVGGNLFARKGPGGGAAAGRPTENRHGNALGGAGAGAACKRKAPAGNPFARKVTSKTARH
eukprot:scaffold17.g454.t1